MNNTWIVARREFVTRALKKKFLLITFFMPLIIAIFSGSIGVIMSYKSDSGFKVLLDDSTHIVPRDMNNWANLNFTRIDSNDSVSKDKLDHGFDAILILPGLPEDLETIYTPIIQSKKKIDLATKATLQDFIQTNVKNKKLERLGLDRSKLDNIDKGIQLKDENISGKEESGSEVAAVIGGIFGFFFIYS